MDKHRPDKAPPAYDREGKRPGTQARLAPLSSVKRPRARQGPGGAIAQGESPAPGKEPRQNPEPFAAGPADPRPGTDRRRKRRNPDIPEPADEVRALRRNRLVEGLEKRFHIVENQYHFKGDKGGLAFEVERHHLRTLHEDQGVVSAMVDMAEVRGWRTLKLGGTHAFRRAAWLEARGRGLETSGFRPGKADLARLAELQVERGLKQDRPKSRGDHGAIQATAQPGRDREDPAPVLDPRQSEVVRVLQAIMKDRGDPPDAIARAALVATERLQAARVYTGRLKETGTAPYPGDPTGRESCFIVLEDDKKQRQTIWGADLPRALAASGAAAGDRVALAYRGRKPVEIDVPVKDRSGRVTGVQKETVQRNSWELVPFERLRLDVQKRVERAATRSGLAPEIRVYDRSANSQKREPARPPRPRSPERTL